MRGVIIVDHAGLMALTDDWELGGESRPMEPRPVEPPTVCACGAWNCCCDHPDGACICLPF